MASQIFCVFPSLANTWQSEFMLIYKSVNSILKYSTVDDTACAPGRFFDVFSFQHTNQLCRKRRLHSSVAATTTGTMANDLGRLLLRLAP